MRLCTKKWKNEDGKIISYVGTKINKIINRFAVFGGEMINKDGTGQNFSTYGKLMKDEENNSRFMHTRAGILGLCNQGPNTHGSQFYITTSPAPNLDGKNMILGKCIRNVSMLYMVTLINSQLKIEF